MDASRRKRRLRRLAKTCVNAQAGISREEFEKALAPLTRENFGGRLTGGGSFKASHLTFSFGKRWRLYTVFDESGRPEKLVEAYLYIARPLTPEQMEKIRAAVKEHSTVGSMKEFWDVMGPLLDGVIWHTAAVDSRDFYSTMYPVGGHSIDLKHDRDHPWIEVSFR